MSEKIRRAVDDVLRVVGIWTLASAAGGAAVVAVAMNYAPDFVPYLLGPGQAFVLVLVGIAAWKHVRRLSQAQPPPMQIEQQIQEWAMSLGHSVNRTTDPLAIFSFGVRVPTSNNIAVQVARTKDESRFLTFVSAITFDAPAQEWLSSMGADRLEAFVMGLRVELNRLGIDYAGLGLPLNQVRISKLVLIRDGLTIQDFAEAVMGVLHAHLLIGHRCAEQRLLLRMEASDKGGDSKSKTKS
jgi:hypothetical protein